MNLVHMFERLEAGWKIGSLIRKEVFKDRQLMLYPLLSIIVIAVESILIIGSFLILNFSQIGNTSTYIFQAEFVIALFMFYLIS